MRSDRWHTLRCWRSRRSFPGADGEKIRAGLKDIIGQIEEDPSDFNETLEDVHSNIEFKPHRAHR